MSIQNDMIQKDPRQADILIPLPPLEEPAPVRVDLPRIKPVIIGGPSVVVTSSGGGVDAMVAKLKAERDNAREDYARTQLSSALSAVLDRIQVRDAEQQKILDDLKVKSAELSKLNTLDGKIDGAINATKVDLANLTLKIKKINAMIEALKKTPEEKQKEIEFKEKMAKLEGELKAAKDAEKALGEKLNGLLGEQAKVKGQIKTLTKDVNDLLVKLDALSSGAVTQALKDLGISVEDVREPEAEKKSGKMDGMPALLRLLAGERQSLSDAVEERSPKMV